MKIGMKADMNKLQVSGVINLIALLMRWLEKGTVKKASWRHKNARSILSRFLDMFQ